MPATGTPSGDEEVMPPVAPSGLAPGAQSEADILNDDNFPLSLQDLQASYEEQIAAQARSIAMLQARLKGCLREIAQMREAVSAVASGAARIPDARPRPRQSAGTKRKR